MSRAGILLICLLVAGFAALLFMPQARKSSDVPFTAGGVTLHTYTEEGDLWWEVFAHEGEIIGEESLLRDVEVRFLSSPETSLIATADRFTRGERESILSGAVLVERGDGLRLETDEMTWNDREGRLRTEAIQLSFRDVRVEGEQFEYDLRTERATLIGGITATIDREEVLSIRGDRAEEMNDVFTVEGNVLIESGEGTYSCERIEANDDAARLTGAVDAIFREGELRADRAEIDNHGLRAWGAVSLRLDLASEEKSDGP